MLFSTKSEQIMRKRIEKGLTLGRKRLQNLGSFKYQFYHNDNCSVDIRVRTATALKVMRDIDYVWRNKNVSKKTKMRLFSALIVPIALFCCEAWTLKKAEENQLLVFVMAALTKILGIHIMDKMRNENVRMALDVTDTIVQNVHERP